MTKRVSYVVGFCFDDTMEHVILIRKRRPAWQKDLLNGVGGKVEPGEDPYTAMMREFYEEAGVTVDIRDWTMFQVEKFPAKVKVFFFYATNTEAYNEAYTATDEQLEKHDFYTLPIQEMIPNLTYLIPMAIAKARMIPLHVQPILPFVGP